MFFSSFRTQFSFAIRQKITLATFGLLFVIVGLNFVGNVLTFQGMDITTMYHPMKLLLLTKSSSPVMRPSKPTIQTRS